MDNSIEYKYLACCILLFHLYVPKQICDRLQTLSIRSAQTSVQSCITWPKKSGKGKRAWVQACRESQLNPRMLSTPVNTRFASRVIMFKDALRYRQAIHNCYIKQAPSLQQRIPTPQTWAILETVASALSPLLSACVINQCRGYWLLSDALSTTIELSLKFSQEKRILEAAVGTAVRQDFGTKLKLLGIRIREEVITVLRPFLKFLDGFSKSAAHNMLCLMLDPRFKDLSLVSRFLGSKSLALDLAREYDNQCLVPYLAKIHESKNPAANDSIPYMGDAPSNSDAVFGPPTSAYDVAQDLVSFSHHLLLTIVDFDCYVIVLFPF